jgi:hypothetical protein
MCTRAVSTLAHVFEAEGLATVALVANRVHAARIHPPRALYCDFPLGRPLGRPRDPAFQQRVLAHAFSLLGREAGPVLEDFPEAIHDAADEPVACPLPPRHDPDLAPAVDEARGLRPAWERARAANGGSQVGRVVDVDGIPAAIEAFVRIADGTPWPEAEIPGDPAATLMDIRCYYEEVATALCDHVPAARAAESWYYQRTATGDLMRRVLERLAQSDPPFPGLFYIAPFSQQNTIPLPG